jgi:hypothetical protein
MFEGFIERLLRSYLNEWIHLQESELQLSVWKGAIQLKNLNVRHDALQASFKVPVTVAAGQVGSLQITVRNWRGLSSDSVPRDPYHAPLTVGLNVLPLIRIFLFFFLLSLSLSLADTFTSGSRMLTRLNKHCVYHPTDPVALSVE